MSKPTSDHLFRLIHSLTPSEKGYIKKAASHQGEKHALFLRLFDAISRQPEYDERVLQRHPEFGKNLPRLKHYLYERILHMLEQYHSTGNISMQLHHQINHITVLYEKGLYERCDAQIARARTLCEKYENFPAWLHILGWERKMATDRLQFSRRRKIQQEERTVAERMMNMLALKDTYDRISAVYIATFLIRSAADHSRYIKEFGDQPAFAPDHALSFQAKIMYLKAQAKYCAALNDCGKYLQLAREAVDLYEQNPHFILQDVHGYIRVLNNLLATLAEHKEYEEYDRVFHKLKTLPLQPGLQFSGNLGQLIHVRLTLRDFYRRFAAAEWDQALALVPEVEHLLVLDQLALGHVHRQIFTYSIATLLYITGHRERALIRTEQLLGGEVHPETVTYIALTRILQLFIHYDAGHLDLVEYMAASTRSFLIRHEKYYAVEKLVIRYLGHLLPAATTPAQQIQCLRQFRAELEASGDSILERSYEYFDPVGWIDARLEGGPLSESYSRRILRAGHLPAAGRRWNS